MPYTHLSALERCTLEFLLKAGLSFRAIAQELGRSPSTISRELAPNRRGRGSYRALDAQYAYRGRRAHSRKPQKLVAHTQLCRYVETKLTEDWAPEQIAGRLPLDYPNDATMRISHETIYAFIYADKRANGTLYTHLRQAHRKRRRRANAHGKRGLLPGRVCIEQRPAMVESRQRTGDWEADLVFGRQSGPVIVTLVERKHRYLLAHKVENKRAYPVGRAILHAYRGIPLSAIHTITFDNGKEFAHFKSLEHALDASTYFAHPYAAWERGTNENTNGLLRQYIPKGSDLRNLTQKDLNSIVRKLNNRPRKILGFRTPAQDFKQATVALQC